MSNMIPPVGVAMAWGRTRAWRNNFKQKNLPLCNKAQDCISIHVYIIKFANLNQNICRINYHILIGSYLWSNGLQVP